MMTFATCWRGQGKGAWGGHPSPPHTWGCPLTIWGCAEEPRTPPQGPLGRRPDLGRGRPRCTSPWARRPPAQCGGSECRPHSKGEMEAQAGKGPVQGQGAEREGQAHLSGQPDSKARGRRPQSSTPSDPVPPPPPQDLLVVSTDENQVFVAVQEWYQTDTYNLYQSDPRGVAYALVLEDVRSSRRPGTEAIVDILEVGRGPPTRPPPAFPPVRGRPVCRRSQSRRGGWLFLTKLRLQGYGFCNNTGSLRRRTGPVGEGTCCRRRVWGGWSLLSTGPQRPTARPSRPRPAEARPGRVRPAGWGCGPHSTAAPWVPAPLPLPPRLSLPLPPSA